MEQGHDVLQRRADDLALERDLTAREVENVKASKAARESELVERIGMLETQGQSLNGEVGVTFEPRSQLEDSRRTKNRRWRGLAVRRRYNGVLGSSFITEREFGRLY